MRMRRPCLATPFGIAALLGLYAGCALPARAQPIEDPSLLGPPVYKDTVPFKRPSDPKPPSASPPANSAGTSGFDASNAPKKKKPKRAIETKNLPVLPVRPQDATLAPVYQQQPDAAARYSRRGTGGVTPDTFGNTFRRPLKRKAEEDPYAPLGIVAGAFILKPAVEITTGRDSNPGRTHNGPSSPFVQVAPELQLKSDWLRHEVSTNLRGGYIWYSALPSFDKPNFDGKANARIDVTSDTRANVEGRYSYTVDSPGDPNLPASVSKPPVNVGFGGSAGLTQQFNALELTLKGNADRSEYGDATLNGGTLSSQKDRNFDQYSGQLRGGYEIYPGIKPFVEGMLDTRIHDLESDASGFQRDSDGRTIKVGSTFQLAKKLVGEVSVGYTTRSYKDARLPELRGMIADSSLVWYASPLTTATFIAKSSVDESTILGVSGILHRDVGFQIDHSFRRWLIGTVKLGYGLDSFQGDVRKDQRYAASAGLIYKINREVQLKGEFRQEWLRSNISGNDYTASVLLFGLRIQR